MKKQFAALVVAVGMFGGASSAMALDSMFDLSTNNQAISDSQSASESQSNAGANAFNGGITLNMAPGPSDIKYRYGSQTIRNTPGVILGGFSNSFSADYCGGTAQAGLSLPGLGLSGGGPKMDPVCQGLRWVEKVANLAQQRSQVSVVEAGKLMRAADIVMCGLIPGKTDVALTEAGIDCGSATPKENAKAASNSNSRVNIASNAGPVPGH